MDNRQLMEDCGSLEYTLIETEPIIGFNLWGERRICLPQLLRFVLPDFDINIIDRAVTDLQINCFQCNSEQMNLLHVNNIVPKEISLCGLIRKSDAERLCKYLLQRNKNYEQLNDNLSFINHQSIEVIHTCFGEQRGILYPILYVSADSECIKCITCDKFFKTFEFVGHTHKLDEVSNTFHWGFDSNNWRMLLQIFVENKTADIKDLNETKAILDKIKSLFYEKELTKINKSNINIVWRPSRKLKLPIPQKRPSISLKPSHLNEGPVEVYTKNNNISFTNLREGKMKNSEYVPNVYLNSKDNIIISENTIDDDDIEEYEYVLEPSIKTQECVALNVALQIKLEADSKGTVSSFFNKSEFNPNAQIQPIIHSANKPLKSNCNPVVVAQPNTSIPPQFLMLEALWSQLFRDIIQLTQLVKFNTDNERNRLVNQLMKCQDLFRSQWSNLVEENQNLKKALENEQKRQHDIDVIQDKMASSLKELTMENENQSEMVKKLESMCHYLQLEINLMSKKSQINSCGEDRRSVDNDQDSSYNNERFIEDKIKLKRQIDNKIEKSEEEDNDVHVRKQMKYNILSDIHEETESSFDE